MEERTPLFGGVSVLYCGLSLVPLRGLRPGQDLNFIPRETWKRGL